MKYELTWLGHGSWSLATDDHRILVDPFLNDSPTSPVSADEVEADFILVSHGHFDHIADVASIAKRTGAKVIAIFEIAQWLKETQGVENVLGMNVGGGVDLPFGHVKMTPAFHSSQLPDGSYGGEPAGFVISLKSRRLYFACDTALFSDMALLARQSIDVAILPIGDLFTMGIADSIEAIRLVKPSYALPAHYNTWPPIAQDAAKWAERVSSETDAAPVVLQPGQAWTLP